MPKPAVLIVDDIEDNRIGLVDWLEEDFECLLATDADEAERILVGERPRVILLDLSLPGRSGWEFASHLKADPRTRDIPIIAMSAYAGAKHRDRALEAGCDIFLSKPFRLNRLIELLNAYRG